MFVIAQGYTARHGAHDRQLAFRELGEEMRVFRWSGSVLFILDAVAAWCGGARLLIGGHEWRI
jgi:hypothetical protein